MNPGPVLANSLWLASGAASAVRFRSALDDPAATQGALLRDMLVRHSASDFGRRHTFATIRNAADYSRRVPLARYDDFQPYIARIASGERDVLSCGAVSHLAPTSGSTGGRKLVPFTPALTAAFNSAVFPWLLDLATQRPRIVGGPAYWSISPLDSGDAVEPSAIPIGFADDAEYLGGPRAWLVRQAMAAPSSVRFVRDTTAFWRLTLLALLRCRNLRLISIWHPSFMQLLTAAAEPAWGDLVEAVGNGENPWAESLPPASRAGWTVSPDPERALELTRVGPADWAAWWPQLQVLSCWGEQAAEPGWRELVRRLPRVLVQAKGLLATECAVTVPLGSDRPLAITSHYFEFLDAEGETRLAHQLVRGRSYEVVVTNGGGLWRYRLGDIVECAGHVGATPSLRFVGRNRVSDLRGEKLSEAFVAEVLRDLWTGDERPSYATLRPRDASGSAGYELLIPSGSHSSGTELGTRLDAALAANPHYALARRLGQLSPVSVVTVNGDAPLDDIMAHQGRIGDAKPRVLLEQTGAGIRDQGMVRP